MCIRYACLHVLDFVDLVDAKSAPRGLARAEPARRASDLQLFGEEDDTRGEVKRLENRIRGLKARPQRTRLDNVVAQKLESRQRARVGVHARTVELNPLASRLNPLISQRLQLGHVTVPVGVLRDLAKASAFHIEQSRQALDPVFGTATASARKQVSRPVRDALQDAYLAMLAIANDVSTAPSQRLMLMASEVERVAKLAESHPPLRQAIDVEALHRSSKAMVTSKGGLFGVTEVGRLTGNAPTDSLARLIGAVHSANKDLKATGRELVVVTFPPRSNASDASVRLIERPVKTHGRRTPQLEQLDPSTNGRFVVDVGTGSGGFALGHLKQAREHDWVVVETDLPDFALAAQGRSDLTIDHVGSRTGEAVLVLGDVLQNLSQFFGTTTEGDGVRRLYLNNVNAHLTAPQVTQLAQGVARALASGGQVDVQWDEAPEHPLHGGDRGHIRADSLFEALQKLTVNASMTPAQPVDAEYSIQPSRRAKGADKAELPTPPDPTSVTGRRQIITIKRP